MVGLDEEGWCEIPRGMRTWALVETGQMVDENEGEAQATVTGWV